MTRANPRSILAYPQIYDDTYRAANRKFAEKGKTHLTARS